MLNQSWKDFIIRYTGFGSAHYKLGTYYLLISWLPLPLPVVEYDEASAYAEENSLLFMETSAKERDIPNTKFFVYLVFTLFLVWFGRVLYLVTSTGHCVHTLE